MNASEKLQRIAERKRIKLESFAAEEQKRVAILEKKVADIAEEIANLTDEDAKWPIKNYALIAAKRELLNAEEKVLRDIETNLNNEKHKKRMEKEQEEIRARIKELKEKWNDRVMQWLEEWIEPAEPEQLPIEVPIPADLSLHMSRYEIIHLAKDMLVVINEKYPSSAKYKYDGYTDENTIINKYDGEATHIPAKILIKIVEG
jgi:hypothetical protein